MKRICFLILSNRNYPPIIWIYYNSLIKKIDIKNYVLYKMHYSKESIWNFEKKIGFSNFFVSCKISAKFGSEKIPQWIFVLLKPANTYSGLLATLWTKAMAPQALRMYCLKWKMPSGTFGGFAWSSASCCFEYCSNYSKSKPKFNIKIALKKRCNLSINELTYAVRAWK